MKKSILTLVLVVIVVAALFFAAFHGIGSAIQPVSQDHL